MKKNILVLLILISSISFSQSDSSAKKDKKNTKKETLFTFDSEGLNPKAISIEILGVKKKDLYTKTKDWIKMKYENLDQVITKDQKDKKITISGFADNAICFGLGSDYGCEGLS
jgi:hypothetical protein